MAKPASRCCALRSGIWRGLDACADDHRQRRLRCDPRAVDAVEFAIAPRPPQANRPRSVGVELNGPLIQGDVEALDDVLAWNTEVRSDQAKVNALVDVLLIGWVAEASGRSPAEVVQRLALAIESLLPPS